MTISSVAGFVDLLGRVGLLPPIQQEELTKRLQPRFRDPHELAKELLRRAWLTPYQVNQLFQEGGQELVLGHYALLERLGQGAMGQVFKARNQKLSRIVALKLLRKDLMSEMHAVERFRREIMAAATLNHPNIVMAFDADEIEGNYYYTMEYVEGTTLGHLVKRSGPLPISLATEYTRQVATGLQHAFEHGLVHRDIKPSNLILTWSSIPSNPIANVDAEEQNKRLWGSHMPLMKIFDMGLVTGPVLRQEDPYRPLTQKGTLMGTPDFISPEQAINPRLADTRSDLYSLGATYYFILTGQVPFPGGTPLEKVIRHQTEEARPVETIRAGIPVEVASVVRKLLAKRPDHRYQTPKELSDTLAVLLRQLETSKEARRGKTK